MIQSQHKRNRRTLNHNSTPGSRPNRAKPYTSEQVVQARTELRRDKIDLGSGHRREQQRKSEHRTGVRAESDTGGNSW
jgi:hypothetical protein